MSCRPGLVALVLLAACASAAAQDYPDASIDGPPVRVVPVEPPPIADLSPEERPFREYYEDQCRSGKSSVAIDDPAPHRVILLPADEGEPLTVAVCIDQVQIAYPVAINSLSLALTFMAYMPFEPFWPAATERWSANFLALRADLREQALDGAVAGNAFANSLRGNTAVTLSTASGLTAIGYYDEARTKLNAEIEELAARKARGRHDRDFDLVMLAIKRASTELYQFGPGAAADYLATFSRQVPVVPDYAINLHINHAAYLVEAERYEEALELLLPAYETFRAGVSDISRYNVSGSDREFAWILACAYAHTGDVANAARYERIVSSAEETPQDPYLQQTKPTTAIKLRMYRCMDDAEGYFATWHAANEPILSWTWLEFQRRGNARLSGMSRPWATRPEAESLAVPYRQLPDELIPALERWRAAPASDE